MNCVYAKPVIPKRIEYISLVFVSTTYQQTTYLSYETEDLKCFLTLLTCPKFCTQSIIIIK